MVENKRAVTLSDIVLNEGSSYLRGVRWVWIDLDDTLIDFRANSLAALRITYEQCSLERYFRSCDEWIECYMRHNHALWDRYNRAEITQGHLRLHRFLDPIRERTLISEEEFAAEARHMDILYLSILARQKCMVPGAMELVEYLRAHAYNIGILSNGFSDVQYRKLHTVGLDALVDTVVLSDDIGVNKPDPRIFIHAMERVGDVCPDSHLMIGDNPSTDIDGARGAGWRSVLFDRSAGRLSISQDGIITPSLREMIPLLSRGDNA